MDDYLRFELLLEPYDGLIGLHVDIKSAQDALLLSVDVRNQLKRCHINRNTDPVAQRDIEVLLIELVLSMTANLLEIEDEVCLKLSHVELEVTDLRQLVHLLDEEHSVVLRCCHEQVVICKPHQTIQLNAIRIG